MPWWAAVGVLELISGLPSGLLNDLFPVYFRLHGFDLSQIGAMSLLTLPWTLRPLWAPLLDRTGTLRAWVRGTSGAMVALLAVVAAVFAGGVGEGRWAGLPVEAVLALLLCVALLGATQDIALDGYLVTAVPPGAGRANGLRISAYRGAMALAGGGGVVVGARWGWGWALGGVLALQAALSLATWWLAPSPPRPAVSPAAAPGAWAAGLGAWLAAPAAKLALATGVLFKVGDAAMAPMVKPFWLASGMRPEAVGLFASTAGSALTALGALAGGEVLARHRGGRGLLILGGLQLLPSVAYALTASLGGASPRWVYGAAVLEALGAGFGSAALLSLFTRAAAGAQVATRFALLAAASGVSKVMAASISGVVTERVGFAAWFATCAVLALPGLVIGAAAARAAETSGRSDG